MRYENLMQLSELQSEGKSAKVLMRDGSVMICQPDWWSEEEDCLAFSVRLIKPWDKYRAGSLFTVFEDMIRSVEAF